MVGVQQKSGIRRSPELGAQTSPLRCQVQINLTRSKAASALSLCSHTMLMCTMDEVHGGERPFSNQPSTRAAVSCLRREALSACSTIPRRTPCADHVWT